MYAVSKVHYVIPWKLYNKQYWNHFYLQSRRPLIPYTIRNAPYKIWDKKQYWLITAEKITTDIKDIEENQKMHCDTSSGKSNQIEIGSLCKELKRKPCGKCAAWQTQDPAYVCVWEILSSRTVKLKIYLRGPKKHTNSAWQIGSNITNHIQVNKQKNRMNQNAILTKL